MPWSAGTPPAGASYPLVDAGHGSPEDLDRLGATARGALLLVETPLLTDIAGLFVEYSDAAVIEERAASAGAAGVVYMASRPSNTLYRHNASYGPGNTRPMLIMERDAALRALRLLRRGTALDLDVTLDIASGPEYESYNVIGEIRGSSRPEPRPCISRNPLQARVGHWRKCIRGCHLTTKRTAAPLTVTSTRSKWGAT